MPTVEQFLAKYGQKVIGVLSGWDRLVFRGQDRMLGQEKGMMQYLWRVQVLLKDFTEHAKAMTATLIEGSYEEANRLKRPTRYLASSSEDKEKRALKFLGESPVESGLVCVLSCVEPCVTYEIHKSREKRKLELKRKMGKCLHLYHYYLDPEFGWMNARIQTWYPFTVQVCLNGREWLARKMDKAGPKYERYDNSFPWIEDFPKAQRLMDGLLHQDWPRLLDRMGSLLNPKAERMFESCPLQYYWTAYQTEWATDIAFGSQQDLEAIYPQLVWGAITSFSSEDILRFLGRPFNSRFSGEVTTTFKHRPEGICVKHRVNGNSQKMYNKGGNILRPEATINQPQDLKVYRASERDPNGPKKWRPMRKGVADMRRRGEVCQKANERYLEGLAQLDTTERLEDLFAPVSKPRKRNGKKVRALRLWTKDDQALLEAINRPEFLLAGFRNRDIAHLIYPGQDKTPQQRRSDAARVSYRLRILRVHGLIAKLQNTRRYRTTPKGQQIATAAIVSQKVTVQQLAKAAA